MLFLFIVLLASSSIQVIKTFIDAVEVNVFSFIEPIKLILWKQSPGVVLFDTAMLISAFMSHYSRINCVRKQLRKKEIYIDPRGRNGRLTQTNIFFMKRVNGAFLV